ncbi:competence protein CoiA [Roseibium polysiphoniae]|uniref:CoiA-like domain protein n=1 Tax=Roseibium polysiphoniae TaxID=2571221 RepID=A0ABR9C6F5_9HYPH|nr:competence protein CoiA family protein [Roseibium polysiphoniae]MBD8875089.1 CoiA-like domain protein [Roseibium polysiphoniae]
MQYAIVDDGRREAFRGGRGTCPTCGASMHAKCGPRVIHHWAHQGRRNCDPWWENETQWHREWKNLFPEPCREVSHTAPNGEIHRADIKTPTGIYIEVQHSRMTDAERISREAFYQNLVWVIDGKPFRKNFDIYHMLPDPMSDLAQDLVWSKAARRMNGANRGLFFRVSANQDDFPGATKATLRSGWIEGIDKIEAEVKASYRGHHQYDWVRPRKTWLDATCPVYIDFGDDWLCRLEVYDETGLKCIRLVAKRQFIHDVMTEASVADIASRFYSISS